MLRLPALQSKVSVIHLPSRPIVALEFRGLISWQREQNSLGGNVCLWPVGTLIMIVMDVQKFTVNRVYDDAQSHLLVLSSPVPTISRWRPLTVGHRQS